MDKRKSRIIVLICSIGLIFPLFLLAIENATLIDSLIISGKMHMNRGRSDYAVYLLMNALQRARDAGERERLRESMQLLAQAHENLGDYKTANIYLKKMQRIQDSLFVFQLEKAGYIKSDSVLTLSHHEYIGKLESSKKRQFYVFFIILIMILFASTLIIVYNYQHTKKRMQKIIDTKTNDLKEANTRLEKEIIEKTESEEKFRTIFEHAPVMIDAFDDMGKCLLWNRECERQLGWSEEEIISVKDPLNILYPDRKIREKVFQWIVNADGTVHEDTVTAKDGSRKVQCWSNYKLSPGFYLCVGFDITERKTNEEALMSSKERYKQLMNNSPSLILEFDVNNHSIISCNPAMADSLGSTVNDIIGNDIRAFLPDAIFRSRYKVAMEALKENKVVVSEDSNKGRYFYNTVIPVVSGERKTLQIISYDITERKKIEMELKEREAFLQSLIYNIPLDFYTRDKEGKVIMQSAKSIQKWGDLRGLTINDLDIKDSLKKLWREAVRSALSGNEVEEEYTVSKKDATHYFKMYVSPIIRGDEITGILGVDIDITEERENEKKLIQLKDNLESVVDEEIKKRKDQQELLIQKSKLESLGQLAAGIAHEINQPIGLIALGLDNVLEKLGNDKTISVTYLKDKIENFFKYIDRIRQIIDHIGTFSRDQKDIIFDELNINTIIEQALTMIKHQYKDHNITFNVKLDKNIPIILGKAFKVEQVILNLLSNSFDALEARSQRETGFQKNITIKTFKKRKTVVAEFTDNGVGIPKNDIESIFDPFYTTKGPDKGTGLGLSISYGILEEMNATISVDSILNEFTTFTIEFQAN
ncbi:MAG: PAS domain S-box protein [Candidatus Cloacimonetes bacterium]|nr:PAS domain S-box protein [Candidatus Cloacimonadota bacterium]